jgi:hypothetical protein
MRYDVDTTALREDVLSIEEVLLKVRGLGIAEELRPIAAAMPGGRCGPGLHQVAAAWEARLAATRGDLQELGRGLAVAADTNDAVEQSARLGVHASFGVRS